MTRTLKRLLTLTRHAFAPGPLCQSCLDQQLREELASLSRAQDIAARTMSGTSKGARLGESGG